MKRITKSSDEEYLGDDTIYTEDFREDLVDSGEISAWEAAFMQGYDEAG